MTGGARKLPGPILVRKLFSRVPDTSVYRHYWPQKDLIDSKFIMTMNVISLFRHLI